MPATPVSPDAASDQSGRQNTSAIDRVTRIGTYLGLRDRLADAPSSAADRHELLLVTAGFLVVIAIVLHDQLLNWYGVPDRGDPLFSMWRMGWVAYQIVRDPRHLFDTNIFYPERATLTYSDSMLLPSLVAAPLIWLGAPLAIAYTLLLLASFVVTGIATYMLARALGLSRGAAWTSALLFAVCQYKLEHYSHLELQMTMWMPLTVLAAVRLLSTGRMRYVVWIALASSAQWYSSMYYGVFLTVYAGVFIATLALIWRTGVLRFVAAIAGVAMGIVLALPLARVYKSTEGDRGTRNVHAVNHYSAIPADYLQPNKRSVYADWNVVRRRVSERELFPHFTPLALAAAGIWPPFGATRVALLVSGLVAFDGSLGFNGTWYHLAYENVSPLRSMRVPARFAVLVNLSLALFAGFGATRLIERARTLKQKRLLWLLVSAVFIVESIPTLKLIPVWSRPPLLYSSLGPQSGAVLFEFPVHLEMFENFAYIYFSTWHWTRMVNGYSGYFPKSYHELEAETADFPRGDSVAYLQKRGVTHVTLHCAFWTEEACALAMDRLSKDPRFHLATSTWWEGRPAQLYELSR